MSLQTTAESKDQKTKPLLAYGEREIARGLNVAPTAIQYTPSVKELPSQSSHAETEEGGDWGDSWRFPTGIYVHSPSYNSFPQSILASSYDSQQVQVLTQAGSLPSDDAMNLTKRLHG